MLLLIQMSKVANYLNEHILGEVSSNAAVLHAMSTDGSVLTIVPEMVVYPRTTNDIRKVARFSNQLAEKGHALPITARGGGSDQTAAAIGSGIILNTTAHMNAIFELDSKQKLVRLQPGVNFKALNDALLLHGLHIPSYPASAGYSTIGGAVANNASGILSGKYGSTGRWIHQLEIVLSNGDVMQTGRISKRELNRKKGQQTFEGEVYRQIDNLITDNDDLIANSIALDVRDNAGYAGIVDVKRRDGSMDLTPLFIGSQGTLGIISELIMKAEYASAEVAVAALAFETHNAARDAADSLRSLDPCLLEFIDGPLFETALERGKKYRFYTDAIEQGEVAAVLLVGFDDMSERHRSKKIKKTRKLLQGQVSYMDVASDAAAANELLILRDVSSVVVVPDGNGESAPPLVDGAYIPPERFEDFMTSLVALASKFAVQLPLYGRLLDNVYYVRPSLQLHKVGDKQKVFKFVDEYSHLVVSHRGHLIGESAEGRFKASFAYKEFDDDLMGLYDGIKAIFDPLEILNPGVKQKNELKTMVAMLRKEYNLAAFAGHSPTN